MSNFRRSSHGIPSWSFKNKSNRASCSESNGPSSHPTPDPTFPDLPQPASRQAQWERQFLEHDFTLSSSLNNPAQGGHPSSSSPPLPPSPSPTSAGPPPNPNDFSYMFSDYNDENYDADVDDGDVNLELILFGYVQLMNLTKEVERLSNKVKGLEREIDDCRIIDVDEMKEGSEREGGTGGSVGINL